MRVANFTDTYLPRRDGVITSIRTLVEALGEQGHQSMTVVPRHPDQRDDPGLLRLRAVPLGVAELRLSPWLFRGAAAAGTLAEIAVFGPDVVHVHTPGPVGLLGVLAARRLGLPLVQTYHTDLHAYAQAYRFPVPAIRVGLRLYARRLGVARPPLRTDDAAPAGRRAAVAGRRRAALDGANELLLGGADAVVVPTRAVLDRITLPVGTERIHLIPTGVLPRQPSATAVAEFRRRHGLLATDQVVLFVGRVNREKGVDLLLPAFERLLATCPRARLVLVGAMYEPRWFAGLVRAMPAVAAARVVLAGEQPPDVVAAAYAAADVLAFTSRTDTQALVLQEAALAGVPAVLVDPALHRDGPLAGAAACAPADPDGFAAAVADLLEHPERARAMAEQARRNASRHTPAEYAGAILGVYRHAAARHSARRSGSLPARRPGHPVDAMAASVTGRGRVPVG